MPRFFEKNKYWIIFHSLITFILLLVFFLEFKVVGQSVYGDARYYIGFTRSIYFSQNIDITDEIAHYWSPESNNKPASFDSVPELKNVIKVTTHNFSLGISVIWLPIYFIADILVILASKFNPTIVRNGYSDIYQIILGMGNILFVVSGLIIISKILSNFYSRFVSSMAIISILFTTNLFYYSAIDVVNTHPFSFLGTSSLLYLFFKHKEKKNIKLLFIQGIILGLLTANRMQDGILILIPLFTVFSNLKIKKIKLKSVAVSLIITGAGGLVGYLPQLILLFLGQGKFLLIPHLVKAENDFSLLSHLSDIFVDQKLGILFYMPSLIFSFVGLYLLRNKKKIGASLYLTILFLVIALISSYDGWNVAGYTARYFISIFPILVFGFAEVINIINKKYSKIFLYFVILIFIFHQGISILSFKLFWQDPTYVGSELSQSGKIKMKVLETVTRHLSM